MTFTLANSTYFDLSSHGTNATALPASFAPAPAFTINVALVLDRANDPTTLLSGSWASRQAALADQTTVFQTYGADPTKYNDALTALTGLGIPTLASLGAPNYVSSVESRTIWVQLDNTSFATLFGTSLQKSAQPDQFGNKIVFWNGSLSLPDSLHAAGVSGLWFDTPELMSPILATVTSPTGVTLPLGPQGVGNSGPVDIQFPNVIADLYNFPFSDPSRWTSAKTGTVGLIEPGVGTATNAGNFQVLLDTYRTSAGLGSALATIDVSPGGQLPSSSTERSLDVSIVTTVNPLSTLALYVGSGYTNSATSDSFTAYQQAFWDNVNNPAVVSSSFKSYPRIAPDSPFYFAMKELFVDAALHNITMVNAAGDGGSGDSFADGTTNIASIHASPYSVVAGGASITTLQSAAHDETLNGANRAYTDIYSAALAGDLSTLWQLVAGGLTVLPANAAATDMLLEAAWNTYSLAVDRLSPGKLLLQPGFLNNYSGSGGVDATQPQPSYQTAFGLDLHTSDPAASPGRGIPDVAAASGGNMHYLIAGADMAGTASDGGTSAAAPLWAALFSQINAAFQDQGLSNLGYTNDLLYIAAAIAPGAFNDITLGNNVSSFVLGGNLVQTPLTSDTSPGAPTTFVTPTGYGYYAGPGYDMTTGLGSPNGMLLARAMTAIAHAQTSFGSSPAMLDADGHGGWSSGADQVLMFQAMSDSGITVEAAGDHFASAPSGSFAWTSRMAQQVMQPDFDPALVRLFDKQAQGWVGQSEVVSSEHFVVSINNSAALALQGTLSSAFGFADFTSASGAVRVARPVAVAETAGGADDTTTIVRVRQNGEDNLSVSFYRVDDLNGTIGGIAPGQDGYGAAAQQRAYQLGSGGTSLDGPGYGNFGQSSLLDVDAGDLIAMRLVNNSSGHAYWAFAQANESVAGHAVGHLWSYGLNTWGWEDTWGGGDRDFNDLIVQLDFTSASGHGWLV
ncbi:MAG: hypothetical protein LCH95_11800 [Proteobacteria bacterium]|nr:hypothetical protein [Pseudomonadota bacterium]